MGFLKLIKRMAEPTYLYQGQVNPVTVASEHTDRDMRSTNQMTSTIKSGITLERELIETGISRNF